MTVRAHVLILVLTGGTLAFMLTLVRRHRIRAKYSVLWLSLGVGLAVLASAPTLMEHLSHLAGVRTPALMFLLMAITFLLILSLHFSWELSRLEDRIRRLAEECALLREEVGPTLHRVTSTRPSVSPEARQHDQAVGCERSAQTAKRPLDPQEPGARSPQQPHLS